MSVSRTHRDLLRLRMELRVSPDKDLRESKKAWIEAVVALRFKLLITPAKGRTEELVVELRVVARI